MIDVENKYKMYTLYAKIVGSYNERYTIDEALRDDRKRQQTLMSGSRIEDIDKLTDDYESIEELLDSYPEEVLGKKLTLYEPIIIVDKHITDRSKSYEIYDIVFREDAQALKERNAIREEVRNYLMNNPDELKIKNYPQERNKFRGISKNREAYFTLKYLNPERVKNNGIHR